MSIVNRQLNRGQIMTRDNIVKEIKTMRVGYDYMKIRFYNGIYLMAFYTRDNKVYIKTNSRDLNLWKEIDIIERTAYREPVLADFFFRWITKLTW